MEFIIQIIIVLLCLLYGTRKGGIGLGFSGGTGILLLVFLFGLKPGQPPVDVMLVIIAVVAASATLQASGGLDVLLQLSEKIIRHNPKYISIIAPLSTYFLTILCGTGHVVYALFPIIYNVAIRNDIRPERPMAASSIASQMGIIASPISVATVSLAAMLSFPVNESIDIITLLSLTIPATLCGILSIGLFSWFRGKNLRDDDKFLKFIHHNKENYDYVYGSSCTLMDKTLPRSYWTAIGIFLTSIMIVTLLGIIPGLRPGRGEEKISMILVIQMSMLCCGALMIMFTNTSPVEISNNEIFRSGIIAMITVYGIAWMTDTFFSNHLAQIESNLSNIMQTYPWAYVVILLIFSQLLNSQAAALAAVVPIALAVGVHPSVIAATAPACYGYYILPTCPSDLAAIQFDRSGTTRIGRWLINHSFLPVGFLGVGVSCLVGWMLAIIYGLTYRQ